MTRDKSFFSVLLFILTVFGVTPGRAGLLLLANAGMPPTHKLNASTTMPCYNDTVLGVAVLPAAPFVVPAESECNAFYLFAGLVRQFGASAANFRLPGSLHYFVWRSDLLPGEWTDSNTSLVARGTVLNPEIPGWVVRDPPALNASTTHMESGIFRFHLPDFSAPLSAGNYWLAFALEIDTAYNPNDASSNTVRVMVANDGDYNATYVMRDVYNNGPSLVYTALMNWTLAINAEPWLMPYAYSTLRQSNTRTLALAVMASCVPVVHPASVPTPSAASVVIHEIVLSNTTWLVFGALGGLALSFFIMALLVCFLRLRRRVEFRSLFSRTLVREDVRSLAERENLAPQSRPRSLEEYVDMDADSRDDSRSLELQSVPLKRQTQRDIVDNYDKRTMQTVPPDGKKRSRANSTNSASSSPRKQ